jgi:tetratricopeptide (TPR) repeat protein
MSTEKLKPAKDQGKSAPSQLVPTSSAAPVTRPLFRRIDWLTFGVTTLLVFIGYFLTLAPDLTLEDSGELAVGSFYAGVPHPPGYPVWTMFTWLFTVLVPLSNIAWRVALASAVSGALACGLIALIASRGSSMILEGIEEFKNIDRRWENALCVLAGYVSGMLVGFNGFMWSQAVIVEVYPFSLLSFVGVLCCLLRWIYAPHQMRYLYWALFLFGISFTNHMTLIVAAMGIEVAIAAAQPKLGRDVFLGNSIVFVAGLICKANGMLPGFDNNAPLFRIYLAIGIGSIAAWVWLASVTMKKIEDWSALLRDIFMTAGVGYLFFLALVDSGMIYLGESRSPLLPAVHLAGFGALAAFVVPSLTEKRNGAPDPLTTWRNIVLGLTALYILTLFSAAVGKTTWFNQSLPIFVSHNLIGLLLVLASGWFLMRAKKYGSIVFPVAIRAGLWALGTAFYFYMPLASMTNPPLNWGYPRTWDGFIHALTRGQYEKTNPTSSLSRFIEQMGMLLTGAVDEFNLVYLLVGVIPFFFFPRMQKREQAWFAGLVAMYVCLGVLLMMLLNPSPDRQSRGMNRVFFTASHVMIALCVGYGMTLLGAMISTQYTRFRSYSLYGGAVATAIAIYTATVIFGSAKAPTVSDEATPGLGRAIVKLLTAPVSELEPSQDSLVRGTALFSVGLAAFAVVIFLAARTRPPMVAMLLIYAIMPAKSVLSHWSDNEERGHLFGYWFGHDMFTPPFAAPDGQLSYDARLRAEAMKGAKGKLVYPEMGRNAILFGGTDPGRFCPTYMIFCESFIPAACKPRDPAFDRRDVYIITQNALADGTYLEYIRAHYNRSAQIDPPFFQDMLRTRSDHERRTTNYFAQLVTPLDEYFTALGKRIEDRRRKEGVYPPTEILTPSGEDSQVSFNEYLADAQRRLQLNQLRPGEDVRVIDNHVMVQGQVAVMSINGLLTKVIFDKNPASEFYVEESFPLDWMYSYLEPFGIIMKIDRQPLPEVTDEMVQRDHEFWSQYSQRLIGNWITYDTPVKDICEFAERVYERKDYQGFAGDRKFIRDDQAQKSFSKLRSSIGGVYKWRFDNARTAAEKERMLKEADFAFRQSFAFCPFSPEAVFRYTLLLVSPGVGRMEDAERIIDTALRFDRDNTQLQSWASQIKGVRQSQGPAPTQFVAAAQQRLTQLEREFQTNPGDGRAAFELASIYLQMQKTGAALHILDKLVSSPGADANALLSVAKAYADLQQGGRLVTVLEKLVKLTPDSPEAWYDLASTQALLGKNNEALVALSKAVELSALRLAKQPGAPDLRKNVATNQGFSALRSLPAFQKLIAPP